MNAGKWSPETISKNGRSSKSHRSKRNFLKIALTITATLFVFGAFAQEKKDYEKDPKANERVIRTVTISNVYDNTNDWEYMYIKLLEKAKDEYPNKVIDLRSFKGAGENKYYSASAKVVDLGSSPETKLNETLVKAVDKAMGKVRAGA